MKERFQSEVLVGTSAGLLLQQTSAVEAFACPANGANRGRSNSGAGLRFQTGLLLQALKNARLEGGAGVDQLFRKTSML
jgi:hypothetical protein